MTDDVRQPSHYEIMDNIEARDIIELVLREYEGQITTWEAYCLGNILKYRLRAGKKGLAQKDIDKAMEYESWIR